MPTRALILSDIHANLPALNSILENAKEFEPEFVISLGDYVGYGSFPNEVLETAKDFDVVLMGNHDMAAAAGNSAGLKKTARKALEWTTEQITVENKTFIATFREYHHFTIKPEYEWDVFACHGTPEDYVSNYLRPSLPKEKKLELLRMTNGCKVLMTGHTHIPLEFRSSEGIILNPGSVGQPRDNEPKASAMIVDFFPDWRDTVVELFRVEYDILRMATDMRKKGLPHKLSERLFFGR